MQIPLNESTFNEDEITAAIEVLKSGQLTMGHQCFKFEDQFAQVMKVKNAIFVNSGSSANLLAFFALANSALPLQKGLKRLQPGCEVIVPAVTWSTTIWPIVQAGGVPVLVDSDPKTLQMDVEQVKKAISSKTVAICPVHVLGNAVPMAEIQSLCEKHNLWLIEDTCEALGTRHRGQYVGTFGDLGTYSFYFSHHITTIEGGMIVTNNDELADLVRCLRAHGWTRHMRSRERVNALHPEIDSRFLFVNTGFNVRPTEINAAFGLKQLPKLEPFNRKRREVAEQWVKAFEPLKNKGQLIPMQTTAETDSTWFGFPVMCESRTKRDQFRAHLEKHGIETRPIICGNLARQPAFKNIQHRIAGPLKGADEIMDRGIYWGSHPVMKEQSVKYVIDTVNGFFK